MSAKMNSILFTLVILALVVLTTAFPNGSGTCNSNQTVIEGVQGQPMGTLKELGYTFAIKMENDNYIPGGPPVKFCVHGKDQYKGVLLYALDSYKNHVGSWKADPGYRILKLNCLGEKDFPDGTLTHSDPSLKGPNVCHYWTPPKYDIGPINFVGTVCKGKVDGFQIIRLATIFTVKDSKYVTTATATTCMPYETKPYEEPKKTYENTKPTYEKTKPTYEPTYEKPTYEKPTYKETKPTCEYTKPTYEPEKPTYEKPTYKETKPTYEYTKPTYEPEKPTYEKPYEPTYSNNPIGDFNPPEVSAANGITYTGYILLLQLMIVSSLIFYYH